MTRNAEDIAIEMDELSKQIDDANHTCVDNHVEKVRELTARRDALNILHTAELDKQCYITIPVYGWICFHCGVRCHTVAEAREHFGIDPKAKPVCTQSAKETVAPELA